MEDHAVLPLEEPSVVVRPVRASHFTAVLEELNVYSSEKFPLAIS
eukprot:CAMPEP_0198334104 /NCGR_PEP_ID=MMETSP1450-20131203/19395_1 /TAXON_ID=753684 ORGANISM="Madagascaria erythrocladiodes, Strain CCMP3234" /NCGR_SAMPLE_ID=MMETSP1450 /ASSEMBLY_ACC=CAM_ASM_001115 /LENGTH=44 /DNA_ID= /DNA_START= /DNA_END= /DNA_ORIENTATION=